MLKAIKECMKNWVMTHKKLYWYIVVCIAVLAFGIVTGMGCAKLEKANAAEIPYEFQYLYDSVAYSRMEEWVASNVQDGQHYVVFAIDQNTGTNITDGIYNIGCIISDSGSVAFSDNGKGRYNLTANYWLNVTSSGINPQTGGYVQVGTNMMSSAIYTLEGDISLVGKFPNATNVTVREKPIQVMYSPDAPYVAFDSASLSNLYLDGKPKLFHIGSTFDNKTKSSAWGFTGHLSEWDMTGATEYKLHIEYTVELPTWEYVKQLCEIKEIPYYGWDTCDASAELRHVWDTNENIPKYVYNFIYPINFNNDSGASEGGYIDLNTGLINFYLSFEQIEALIQYFNEDAYSELRNDAAYEKNAEEIRAHYLSYLHIDQVRVVVHADTVGSSVYGPMSVFSFQRDMKKAPLQKVVNVDYMTEVKDSVDDAVNENLMDGLEEYYKDLQTQLDDLQNQIDDIYSVGEGFGGHLEDTDLWSGFQNLAEGLGSLGPSVANISVLTGQVLSFLPLPISNIMYFTIFALCVVAIIKAIRG